MINVVDKSQCCGCSACLNICPRCAIEMLPDDMGFLYPKVNANKCINCGLCEKVCSFNPNYDKSYLFPKPIVYGARNKNKEIVAQSQSGAVFYTIAMKVIEMGGTVYGAGFDSKFQVEHKRAETIDQVQEFRGSKYVQSTMNAIMNQVLADLINERLVLFSGTPCQVAGLRSFLKLKRMDVSNLLCLDLVCHGVPAPYIWRDNLVDIEKGKKRKIIKVNFRDKTNYGWHSHVETYSFSDNTTFSSQHYTKIFYKHLILRQSCSVCYYTNLQRTGDVTICDFWGMKNENPEWDSENKGVSLLMVNTEQGQKILNLIRNDIEYFLCKTEDYIQPNMMHPSEANANRDNFEKDYIRKGFSFVFRKYAVWGIKYRIRFWLKDPKYFLSTVLRMALGHSKSTSK